MMAQIRGGTDNIRNSDNNRRESGSPVHLLYLVGLSALVVCAYDAVLAPFLEGGVNQYQVYEPTESVGEPTGQGRRLDYEERLLAVYKETWPECMDNHMTAIECKDFIDNEIMFSEHFSDEDRYIRVRIQNGRKETDEWYNAVVIPMDDNDLALGRDHDGLIHYDFLWEGSGEAATEEQEKEIPPIIATETPEGAQEGQTLVPETNYEGSPSEPVEGSGSEPESPSGGGSDGSDSPPPPGGQPATSATLPATVDEQEATQPPPVTTEAITTEPTVITTEASLTTEAVTTEVPAVAVTDPPPSSTGATPPAPGGGTETPPDYVDPPLILEYEAVLAIGGTVDNVIAGNETNPINGGVVLSGASTSTADGVEKLNAALAETTTIPEAGARALPPFDCKELSGLDCCILIKHTVRDSDVYNKAIQCFLEYAEGTGKRKYMGDMTSKKVFVKDKGNGYVAKTPKITGSWGNGNLEKVMEAKAEKVERRLDTNSYSRFLQAKAGKSERRLSSRERNIRGRW